MRNITLVEVMIVVAILGIVLAIGTPLVLTAGIDTAGKESCFVGEKTFTKEHYTTSTIYVNGLPQVTTTHHPATWSVSVMMPGNGDNRKQHTQEIRISEDLYNMIQEGEELIAIYGYTRFLRKPHIKHIRRKK